MVINVLAALVGFAAFAAWLTAFVSGVLLLSHVAPPRTAFELLFKGHLFYQRDTFLPSGHGIHRTFFRAVMGFIVCIFLLFIVAMVGATRMSRQGAPPATSPTGGPPARPAR